MLYIFPLKCIVTSAGEPKKGGRHNLAIFGKNNPNSIELRSLMQKYVLNPNGIWFVGKAELLLRHMLIILAITKIIYLEIAIQ